MCYLQVMFDQSGCGRLLRQQCFNTFGLWHPFKHMSQLLFKRFARPIFGPLFFHFFPSSQMRLFEKKRLKEVLIWQQRLRLAYDDAEVKWQMDLALAMCEVEDKAVMAGHLQNMKDLCTIFLPWVSVCV